MVRSSHAILLLGAAASALVVGTAVAETSHEHAAAADERAMSRRRLGAITSAGDTPLERALGASKSKTSKSSKSSKASTASDATTSMTSKSSKSSKSGEKRSDEGGKEERKNDTGSDQKKDFDLSDCSSYSTKWMFDLAHTCDETDDLSNTENCRCDDARKLLRKDTLDCNDYKCPKNCQVCDVCMDVSC